MPKQISGAGRAHGGFVRAHLPYIPPGAAGSGFFLLPQGPVCGAVPLPSESNAGGRQPDNDYPQEDIFDLLQMCAYFITDYSSLALEAAAMDKPTLFYLPDDDRYRSENGVNIDLLPSRRICSV